MVIGRLLPICPYQIRYIAESWQRTTNRRLGVVFQTERSGYFTIKGWLCRFK